MKVPTLEKFLCCMSLATGGTVVGWASIVLSAFEFLSGTKSFLLTTARNVNLVPPNGSPFAKLASSVILFVLYVIFCGVVVYASWRLIEGAKEGNPNKMVLIMALFSIEIILSFVLFIGAVVFWSVYGLIVTSIAAALNSYFLLVVFSLYKKLDANLIRLRTRSMTQELA